MRLFIRFIERALVFASMWWVLCEGDVSSWPFGVAFVATASAVSIRLTPQRGWELRPAAAARFAGFFAYHSMLGGIDVALRALRPSIPIDPGFVRYPMRLRSEAARVLLADTVSLLPGTLSSGFDGDVLVMHVLDRTQPIVDDVRLVEDRIAASLGMEAKADAGDGRGRDAGGAK